MSFTLTWGHVIMVTVAIAAVVVGVVLYVVNSKKPNYGRRF